MGRGVAKGGKIWLANYQCYTPVLMKHEYAINLKSTVVDHNQYSIQIFEILAIFQFASKFLEL